MKPLAIFGISVVVAIVAFLIGWRQDPAFGRFPTPGMTVYFAIFGFIMASLLIFSANAIPALTKGRKAKSEEELESIVVPALQGRECDERIMKWTEIPRAIICGVCLGAVCAAGIHHFIK